MKERHMGDRSTPEQKPFEEPEVATYERDELAEETVFTGQFTTFLRSSDRRLKTRVRAVRTTGVPARLARTV